MSALIPPLVIGMVMLLNGWAGRIRQDSFFEELPKTFASSQKGAAIGGTRDLALVAAGMRKLASDFAMIDTLIYYGTHETEEHGSQHYLDLYPLSKRVLALDPFFRYSVLYASGALAFNESREREAVDLLQEALKKDSGYWSYSLLLSSIVYKKASDYVRVVESLEPVAGSPNAPTMLKNILVNFYLRVGQKEKARQLLKIILA